MPLVQIQFRRDTQANWEGCNPVLLAGELALVTDSQTPYFKLGDGQTAFVDLPVVSGPPGARGEKGEQGEVGVAGAEGVAGAKGERGDGPPVSDSLVSPDSNTAASSKAVKTLNDLLLNKVSVVELDEALALKLDKAELAAYLVTKADEITVNSALAAKADIKSPVFTGVPTAPTPANASNDTTLATTAFVKNNIAANPGIGLSSVVSTSASTQGAINTSVSTLGSGVVLNQYTGLAAGTRTLQDLLQQLASISHIHSTVAVNCNCNCNCDCCGCDGW